MGNNLIKTINNPPLTFKHCFVNGELDITRYMVYRRRAEETDYAMHFLSAIYQRQQRSKKRKLDSLECNNSKGARVHTRRVKKYFLQVRTDDGCLRKITPKDTLWYLLYVKEPPRNNRIADLFRRRFRLPYGCYLTLLDHIKQHPSFCAYRRVDCVGYRSTELSLLLLGSLRYLGRS